MEKFFKEKKVSSIEDLVKHINDSNKRELKSPFRSTIALICLVENTSYLSTLVNNEKILKVIYEYEVPVIKGKGRPSCSDLVVITENKAIIIEAKRTEPKYPAVRKWLDGSENKQLVLNDWLHYIKTYTQEDIHQEDILDIPYQMIHRLASACSFKDKEAKLIYLGFDLKASMKKYYSNNINLLKMLTNNKIDIELEEVNIIKNKQQIILETKWNEGKRDLSSDVIEGIIRDDLMSF